ncbi:VTT domain-containing protein [Aeoliella sp. ICT_H6.2]|uniref:VTT domain-containing protein n=1 Tax=Aeoliella straminimaris TaxID=2954799 RepID=A0A9X2JIL2_9BACT|nr:VTT domain-containing protein [Aeoliella straminimaris]MCO6047200.1 VTT domain-containing protein [Aeoliella straminimaris]
MRSLIRLVLVVAILLGLPLLTVSLWSGPLEHWFEAWRQSPPPAGWLVAALVAVLAADILLPVPSGPVITLAGGQLGIALTAASAWVGLMLGGVAAFAVTKRWGPAVARRLAAPEELDNLRATAHEHDVWLLLVTRPLPILAEATVLLCGALDTRWSRLLWTLSVGNAAVATAFAVLGSQAEEHEWMATAIVLSVVVPLAGTWVVRHRLKRRAEVAG